MLSNVETENGNHYKSVASFRSFVKVHQVAEEKTVTEIKKSFFSANLQNNY